MRYTFILIFSAGFIYSVIAFVIYYGEATSAEARIDELRLTMMEGLDGERNETKAVPSPTPTPLSDESGEDDLTEDGIPTEPEEQTFEIMPHFRQLHKANNDLVGWIKVPGTRIDYPVMQNKDDHLFYDRVNFDLVRDEIGLPYLDIRCEIAPKNQIQIIFGHNIRRRGLIFNNLTLYENKEFWEENQLIIYETLYEKAVYQIFAAIVYDARGIRKKDFQFHRYTHFSTARGFDTTEHNFEVYRNEIFDRALYDTEIDFTITDQLLILATCEYSTSNSRFVLFAKKIE